MKFQVVLMFVALIVPLLETSAQDQTPEVPSTWSLSLGADPSHFDLRTRDPGVDARFIGALTRSCATRFERVRLNAELMIGVDAPRGFRDTDGSLCGGCDVNARRHFTALGAGATVQLLRTGRLKTFISGGMAIYDNSASARSPLSCTDSYCITGGKPFYIWESNRTSLGLNGGLGVSFRLLGREFTLQQSAHVFDFRGGQTVFPLTLGIGF